MRLAALMAMRTSPAFGRGVGSSVGVPLIVRDDAIGALNLYADRPHAFGRREEQLARMMAEQVAVALIACDQPYPEPINGVRPIVASVGMTRASVTRAIELIETGAVPVERLVSLAVPLAEGVAAFERTVHDMSVIKTVLLGQ